MEIFLLFIIFSKLVLGILCLVVLEYQHHKNQKWHQTLPGSTPKLPSQHTAQVTRQTSPRILNPQPAQTIYPTPKKEKQLSIAG